eukprot:SAG11_NODE_8111_length_1059_cov_1.065625_2_plen_92_part_01
MWPDGLAASENARAAAALSVGVAAPVRHLRPRWIGCLARRAQALLWLSREPIVFPGWGAALFQPGYVTDATVAVAVALSLFVWPIRLRPAPA